MRKRIDICDRCKTEMAFSFSDKGMGLEEVGVYVGTLSSYQPAVARQEWCLACRIAMGVSKPIKASDATPPATPPTLEDLVREIVREELSLVESAR